MIGTKFYKPLLDDGALDENGNPSQNTYKHYAEAAQWCNENNATIEDAGDYYEVVAIPEPSDDEKMTLLKGQLEHTVQQHLDAGAQQLDYDSCLAVCSYANCGVEKYEIEAMAFVRWRRLIVWHRSIRIRPRPTTPCVRTAICWPRATPARRSCCAVRVPAAVFCLPFASDCAAKGCRLPRV